MTNDEDLLQAFMDITNRLCIWRQFPSGVDRGVLVAAIMEWCDGKIERGEWLASRVGDFDEYPGPNTIREMIRKKFIYPSNPELDPENANLIPKETPLPDWMPKRNPKPKMQ